MLCCLFEIAMFIFGIVTLINGKFVVLQNRVAYGTPARVIGVILMLPAPLVLGLGFAIALALTASAGGGPARTRANLLPFTTVLEFLVPAICLFAAYAVGITYGQPPPAKRTQDDWEADDIVRRRFLRDLADDDAPRRPPADYSKPPPPRTPDERIQ